MYMRAGAKGMRRCWDSRRAQPDLVIYLACSLADEGLKKKLGKHKAGAGCLYIKKLDDIDRGVLKKLAAKSVAALRKRYP